MSTACHCEHITFEEADRVARQHIGHFAGRLTDWKSSAQAASSCEFSHVHTYHHHMVITLETRYNSCWCLQNRLVSLIAGHLLDTNDEQKVGKGLPEEYKANLRKNVADAISILPKLTTGVDVNVRFHDVKGFEFTDEIAIFDLLDISLVHGWLVDPQVPQALLALRHVTWHSNQRCQLS